MFLSFLLELRNNHLLTGRMLESFAYSGVFTDFSIVLAAVYYVIMGVIPSAKIRKSGGMKS